MNIIDLQEDLKDLPDRRLMQEMQMPTGNMPQFLVLGELQRRKRMRDDYKRQEAADMPTVAEEMITGAGVPQGGLMAMAGAMAPKTNMAQDTGIDQSTSMQATRAPQQPQMAADGGLMKFAPGGLVGTKNNLGGMAEAIARFKLDQPDLYEEYKNQPMILNQFARAYLDSYVDPSQTGLEELEAPRSFDTFRSLFTDPTYGEVSENQARIAAGEKDREMAERADTLNRLRRRADDTSLFADGDFSEPLSQLSESIIQARKADSPDALSEVPMQPNPDDVISSLLPPVSMPDSVLPDRQQDADVPFGAVLGVPTTPEEQIQSYEGADLAPANETLEEAQARIDAQIEKDGYIAAAKAEAEAAGVSPDQYVTDMINDMNREASRDQPNQFPLFTSDNLPSELEQSAAPPAKPGEYGLGIPDILADLNPLQPEKNIGSDIVDLIPPEIQDQINTQIDTVKEIPGLVMDNAGVVGDVLRDTIEMQKLRSEAKTERDGYVTAARKEVEAEAAAKDAANLKEDLDRSLKTGKNTSESALQKALASRQKARDQSFWLDVARAGAKMAQSKNPTLIGAAAEGIESFADSRAKARKQALDYEVAMARIDAAAKKGTTLTLNQRIQALQKERERLEEKLLLMGDDERLKFPLERRIAAISAAIAPYTGMSAMSTGNQPVKIS